jgi:hypothetical protein
MVFVVRCIASHLSTALQAAAAVEEGIDYNPREIQGDLILISF